MIEIQWEVFSTLIRQFNGVVHIVPNVSFFAAKLTGLDFDQQLFKE